MYSKEFEERLKAYAGSFHPVVPIEEGDRLTRMDFTAANDALSDEMLGDIELFCRYVNEQLEITKARYGIGGYNEHRTIYSRSRIFDAGNDEEPRRLHLGTDIWGKPHTRVMAPLNGVIHSFAFHNELGNYGATIVLTHQLEGISFHTLYGHLSLNALKNINEGDTIRKGDVFAEFGLPHENGQWPPHLHFQVVIDMEGMKGDYPGVCKFSERERYLANCPDPGLILGLERLSGSGGF
jgi:peptidoglycan LD-endopeptidase LytH